MMHIVPKWRVTFQHGVKMLAQFHVHKDYVSEVLKHAADMDFGISEPITRIVIERHESMETQTAGVFHQDHQL